VSTPLSPSTSTGPCAAARAGASGNSRARSFCHKIEAELLAIDGFYTTAEEIDSTLRSRPAQAWLEGDVMKITALN
jgi:septum site-determining protein MinC